MAISSIQMFQNNGGNSIEGLLRAGPQAISEIMNQAIQIGRQMSDKQLSQEKDLLNMRQQENAMMQRRAENAQQLFTDTMKFNRDVGEDNRDYAANRSDRAFDQNRQTANDLFSQRIQERRLGLSEQRLGAAQSEAEAERKRKAQQLLDFENQYNGGEPELPVDNPRIDESASISGSPSANTVLAPEDGGDGMVLPPRSSVVDLETELDSAQRSRKTYEELGGDNENVLTDLDRQINTLESRIAGATDKGDAPKVTTAAAERKGIDNLLMNRKFFQPQQSFLKPDSSEDDKAKAKNWDDNKFEAEANAAVDAGSKKAYVDAGGDKSPASVEARGRFYDYAVKTLGGGTGAGGSTTTGTGAVDSIPGI